MRLGSYVLAGLLATLLIGCGDDSDGGSHISQAVQELHTTDVGKYLNQITPDQTTQKGAWTEYRYDAAKKQAVCLSGLPFQVNLRPGSANKVLLYLEGGGACWNEQTCYKSPLAKTSANGAPNAGIIDASAEGNPFKDWDVVYVPYCDGSVFGGDNTVMYGTHETYHHGLMNLSAALYVMQQAFPNPEQIVVAGSSAGGYGTFTGYGLTRVAYPEPQILVLNDSGPGLQNPGAIASVNERLENWKFKKLLPASCENCDPQITYLTEWALDRDPQMRAAYFNYQQDGVLQFFLALDGPSFQSLYFQITDDIRGRQADRFRRFLPTGNTHTILLSDEFFDKTIDGVVMKDWTADFLVNGLNWRDLVER